MKPLLTTALALACTASAPGDKVRALTPEQVAEYDLDAGFLEQKHELASQQP